VPSAELCGIAGTSTVTVPNGTAGGHETVEQPGICGGMQHPGGHGDHFAGQRQGGEAEEGRAQSTQGRRGPCIAGLASAAQFVVTGLVFLDCTLLHNRSSVLWTGRFLLVTIVQALLSSLSAGV